MDLRSIFLPASTSAEEADGAAAQHRTIIGEITADYLAPAARDLLAVYALKEQVKVAKSQIEQGVQLSEISREQNVWSGNPTINEFGHAAPIDGDEAPDVVPGSAGPMGLPKWAPAAALLLVAFAALR